VKLLLVGEDNPHSADPRYALAPWPRGAAGDRLRRLLEMTDKEYLRAFARVNLCRGRWDSREAREKAWELQRTWPADAGIVLLGARVARAFELQFHPFQVIAGRIASLPHPSGRNRQWNEAGAAERARAQIRGMIAAGVRE
jgi:hypothetical protein